MQKTEHFGMEIGQSIAARVLSVDTVREKLLLTMKARESLPRAGSKHILDDKISNPVDGVSHSYSDFSIGKMTLARVTGSKATQLNVILGDNVHARIDASEIFEKWEDIKDRRKPLAVFKIKQTMQVRLIGIHDVKSHRFLPITHRTGHAVYELSARNLSDETGSVLTMDKVKSTETYIGIVNNFGDGCVWVNLSPTVRGRVNFMDLTADIALLNNVEHNYPIGSALKLHVKSVDATANKLDLSALSSTSMVLDMTELSKGMTIPGRVTKITDRAILVQLNESISGVVPLTELADDYSVVDPKKHQKNEIVRVRIVDIDAPNKKIVLSTRPSQVLSSSLPIKDKQITSSAQLKVNEILRGFVKNVSDKGIFVNIGVTVTAFVRVSDLSDSFIKDWRSAFIVDQLVTGKITAVDPDLNHVQMSLKSSVMDKDYVPPITFETLTVRQVVNAKVRKVQTYGVFIVVDNSNNVSGLCHRTQMADNKVDDVTKLYDEGDAVKAIVLKIDKAQRRVNFGLKASYFKTQDDEEVEDSDARVEDDANGGSDLDERQSADIQNVKYHASDEEMAEAAADRSDSEDEGGASVPKHTAVLTTGGFDWSGGLHLGHLGHHEHDHTPDGDEPTGQKKKKKRKPEIQVDKTGELDQHGPKADADFERLLLGRPNDSNLWIQYMAFQLGLGEVEKSRSIAERALKTINMREEDQKLNVWIALINLENSYGNDESVEDVFQRACNYNDKQDIHERVVSIFIESGKYQVSLPFPWWTLSC
jgi:rRNA biogenesis protein RRP5